MESVDYQARLRASFTCSFQIFSFILFEKKKKKIHWNVERWLSYPATLPFFFSSPSRLFLSCSLALSMLQSRSAGEERGQVRRKRADNKRESTHRSTQKKQKSTES